jgi:hypothetical protein
MDNYWLHYANTLSRIEKEEPETFDELKAILDTFMPPSSGEAFFPDGADETLAGTLSEAGWTIHYRESYFWTAKHDTSGEWITYVEGDLYRGDVTRK